MKRPARDDIISALAARVFGSFEFQTTGRRLLPWSKVAAQPACFIRRVADQYEYQQIILPRLTMHLEVWLYARTTPDAEDSPGAVLDRMLDAVDTAFAPDNIAVNRLTLGGLVQHAWIEGEILLDPGDLDLQAKAVIPVRILVP